MLNDATWVFYFTNYNGSKNKKAKESCGGGPAPAVTLATDFVVQ